MKARPDDKALQTVVKEVAARYGVSEERVRSTVAFRTFAGDDSLDVVDLVLALDHELDDRSPPAALA
jgi:acyl carrier protein